MQLPGLDGQTPPGALRQRPDGGGGLSPPGANPGATTGSAPRSPQSSAPSFSMPSGVTGFTTNVLQDMSPLRDLPAFGPTVEGLVQGSPLSELQDSILGSALGYGASKAMDAIGFGPVGGTAAAVAREAVKENPNYGAAALSGLATTAGAMFGGVLGPVGAFVGGTLSGYLAKESLQDGVLGDAVDSRSREKARDAVEDSFGVGTTDTSKMASFDSISKSINAMQGLTANEDGSLSFGPDAPAAAKERGFDFGLTSAFDSTPQGKLSNSLKDPFSLAGFLDSDESSAAKDTSPTAGGYGYGDPGDLGGNGSDTGDTNGKGEGSGHGDRDKGEGGLGGY